MKSFFTALAANLVTVALCVVGGLLLLAGLSAAVTAGDVTEVRPGAVLIIDLARPLSDRPARSGRPNLFDAALSPGTDALGLRAATQAIRAAAEDDRISGILLHGNVAGDGTTSGFAALREMRGALMAFRASRKPIHAYLESPDTRTYYVASTATTITLDPFGSLLLPGLSAEPVFFAGLFEKYGIGVQVSRVGKFKAAVEPFTRRDMSPENRLQVRSYLDDLWSEVRSGIATSRGIDALRLQRLVDSLGIWLPADARAAGLVDRVAYFDEVLSDLDRLSARSRAADGNGDVSSAGIATAATATTAASPAATLEHVDLPQVTLEAFAPIAAAKEQIIGASQAVALVYVEGDLVDGEGGAGQVGGASLARELRSIRQSKTVKAVVVRVNSPGGSAFASEQIQRELSLTATRMPVVVSMSSVTASGGYWISTAARRVFAEPNSITGSIGVFALVPNVQGLANRQGITFDSVTTGRYADLFTLSRPRTTAELAVLQRGTDAVYLAFLDRVARARRLSRDSVAQLAEGRVWSGVQAVRAGLVDSIGGLDAALKSAASLARLTGDFEVREYPRLKSASERLTEILEEKPAPVASRAVVGRGATGELIQRLVREFELVSSAANDPRAVYARLPYLLRIR